VILCVCLNAALDVTYHLDGELRAGASHRVASQLQRAGGKAINVARLLVDAGSVAAVLAPVGGDTGTMIRTQLAAAGIESQLIEVDGVTRRTLTVVDSRDATVFNEAGPHISEPEWALLLSTFDEQVSGADLVVLAGSLPPGIPADAYRQLTEIAAARGVPSIVDAEAQALALALTGHPYLVKPNLAELATVIGGPLTSPAQIAAAGRELQRRGATNAVISCGSAGLVAVSDSGCWLARAQVMTGNPTGAGDALTAALALGTLADMPWPQRLRDGAGMSAAAVADPVAGHVDPQLRAELTARALVEVIDLPERVA
jgi:tagatose 6-phosphate kinase